jgi:hypothetical protein
MGLIVVILMNILVKAVVVGSMHSETSVLVGGRQQRAGNENE